MNPIRKPFPVLLLATFTTVLLLSGTAHAANVINLVGFWQDDNGNFIEIERNGPDAVAVMRSEPGRTNWMRGAMDLSGDDIYLVKKRGTRTVATVRGDLVRGFGNVRIRWNSGRVWKKSSQGQYNDSLHNHNHSHGSGFGNASGAINLGRLPGRWQSNDKTVIEVKQDGHSLSVRVISQSGKGGGNHPWTTGHGRISDSKLSLDCFHGTHRARQLSGVYHPGSRGKGQIKWSNGDVWQERNNDFRLITSPVTAACKLPFDVIGTAIPSRATSTWQYQNGGYFHRGNDGYWNEYGSEGDLRYRYRETERTNIGVTLYDERRRIGVQLGKNECRFRQRSSEDWRRLSGGSWAANRPAVHQSRPYGNDGIDQRNRHSSRQAEVVERESVRINVGIEKFFQGLFRKN